MSSGKTEKIQLNQWEGQDDFLREEFNEDNRKVDALLGEMRYVTLLDVTTTQEAQQVDLDVSSIDFLRYLRLEFYILGCNCTAMSSIWMRTNGLEEGYHFFLTSGTTSSKMNHMCSLTPGRYPLHYNFCPPMEGVAVGMDGLALALTENSDGTVSTHRSAVCGAAPVHWEDLNTLNFVGINQTIPAGTRFVMLGVRK